MVNISVDINLPSCKFFKNTLLVLTENVVSCFCYEHGCFSGGLEWLDNKYIFILNLEIEDFHAIGMATNIHLAIIYQKLSDIYKKLICEYCGKRNMYLSEPVEYI